jgi:hypothetical protein
MIEHYEALCEDGSWVRGSWEIRYAEACGHRHKTARAASGCLRGYGSVFRVASDGVHLVSVHRPVHEAGVIRGPWRPLETM